MKGRVLEGLPVVVASAGIRKGNARLTILKTTHTCSSCRVYALVGLIVNRIKYTPLEPGL